MPATRTRRSRSRARLASGPSPAMNRTLPGGSSSTSSRQARSRTSMPMRGTSRRTADRHEGVVRRVQRTSSLGAIADREPFEIDAGRHDADDPGRDPIALDEHLAKRGRQGDGGARPPVGRTLEQPACRSAGPRIGRRLRRSRRPTGRGNEPSRVCAPTVRSRRGATRRAQSARRRCPSPWRAAATPATRRRSERATVDGGRTRRSLASTTGGVRR